jgi:hypothetical protein
VIQLPSRVLFENEFVRIVLVGLTRETDRIPFQPRAPALVTVTFGRALVRGEGVVRELVEGNQLRLEPGVLYRLRSVEAADLVFFETTRSSYNFSGQVFPSGQNSNDPNQTHSGRVLNLPALNLSRVSDF